MPPKSVPVERVGGPQYRGPWPDDTDEVTQGQNYQRTVRVGPAQQAAEIAVKVTDVLDLGPEQGDVVAYQFDDPSGGDA